MTSDRGQLPCATGRTVIETGGASGAENTYLVIVLN